MIDAVFEAASYGQVGEVQKGIREDASLINATFGVQKLRLLMVAAYGGHLECVRLLCDSGASVDARDKGGRSALYLASCRGHDDIVALLVERGANASFHSLDIGFTPLMGAAANGHVSTVRLLLQLIGDDEVDRTNAHRETALWWACCNDHAEVARALLVEGKANANIADKRDGMTPREISEYRGHHDCVAALEEQRTYILHKARCVHDDYVMQQKFPGAPLPSYMKERMVTGRDLPVLHLVQPSPSPSTCSQKESLMAVVGSQSEGGGVVAAEGSDGVGDDDGGGDGELMERTAVVNFLVGCLNTELYRELHEGLRM